MSPNPPVRNWKEGDLLTMAQANLILPVGKTSLYDLVSAGAIPSIRVASAGSRRGRILIIASGLMEYIDRLRTGTPHAATPRMDVDAIIDRTQPTGASTGRRPRG